MQVSTILHELFSSSIHKTRLKSLITIVNGLIKSKKLQLSQLGRCLNGQATFTIWFFTKERLKGVIK